MTELNWTDFISVQCPKKEKKKNNSYDCHHPLSDQCTLLQTVGCKTWMGFCLQEKKKKKKADDDDDDEVSTSLGGSAVTRFQMLALSDGEDDAGDKDSDDDEVLLKKIFYLRMCVCVYVLSLIHI